MHIHHIQNIIYILGFFQKQKRQLFIFWYIWLLLRMYSHIHTDKYQFRTSSFLSSPIWTYENQRRKWYKIKWYQSQQQSPIQGFTNFIKFTDHLSLEFYKRPKTETSQRQREREREKGKSWTNERTILLQTGFPRPTFPSASSKEATRRGSRFARSSNEYSRFTDRGRERKRETEREREILVSRLEIDYVGPRITSRSIARYRWNKLRY